MCSDTINRRSALRLILAAGGASLLAACGPGATLRWGQVDDIVTTDAFMWAPTANNTTGDLTRIGVKVNLKPTDLPTFTQQGNGNNPPYNGMRLSAGAFAQLYEASSLSTLSRTYGYLSNQAGFYDDRFKDLVATAATEPDAAKRKQWYSQYSDFVLDASYTMVVCPYPDIDLMRPNVEGLRWTLATNVPMSEIWLS